MATLAHVRPRRHPMDERFCTVGDIELCYETFGDAADPAVLLVMGLGTQMVAWHEDLCRELAATGFHVVRFDNRDIGRSTHLPQLSVPPLWRLVVGGARAGYTLADMAGDAVGLLDHLGIERAHLIGVSMGGMIAQTVAARHSSRALSLTSIMSGTGSRWSGHPAWRLYPVLLGVAPREREAFVEHVVEMFRVIGSPGWPLDERDLRAMAALSWARDRQGGGAPRQLAAILASGDRTRELRRIDVPTLVVHGTRDRLVRPSGGRATARAIRGARLMLIEGMGHDLPRPIWPQLLEAFGELAAVRRAPLPARAMRLRRAPQGGAY